MKNNLCVASDIHEFCENYERVVDRIRQLGNAVKVLKTWFVSSELSSAQAIDFIRPALEPYDRLFIIDVRNNVAAWTGIPQDLAVSIEQFWRHSKPSWDGNACGPA